jgi:hypothetical protein
MANPVPVLNTQSIISNNGNDNTNVALSTFIIIQVNGNPVGAIQDLSVNEERAITMVDEVGTDGHIDSSPTRSTNISGSCKRIRYNLMRITSAFGRDFLHNHAQRIPFDITILDNWNGSGANSIITVIENVWIKSLGYTYQQDNWLITDTMNWEAERIYSTQNNNPASTSGNRGFGLQIDPIERLADTGLTGALNLGGLVTEFFQ